MFLQKEYPNKLLNDFKTVNDQRLINNNNNNQLINLGVYYYITFNHKEKNIKTWVPKIATRTVVS